MIKAVEAYFSSSVLQYYPFESIHLYCFYVHRVNGFERSFDQIVRLLDIVFLFHEIAKTLPLRKVAKFVRYQLLKHQDFLLFSRSIETLISGLIKL
jgi:hypothetical protein